MALPINIQDILNGILKGDITYISKAITLIESKKKEHQLLAQQLLSKLSVPQQPTIRIGITGIPGAGKSTFIESLGGLLVEQGQRVAVLTVDPSSTLNKGSVLGDKTRMEKLAAHPNAYIRTSPSSGYLGGVGECTKDIISICEAAGFNYIIIETVGVGQSEVMVHDLTDIFLLLQIAGAGDDLQGIKRGVMEMADAIIITKTDGQNIQLAKKTKQDINSVLHLFQAHDNGWIVPVLNCSSINNVGIIDILESIHKFINHVKLNDFFDKKRKLQNEKWLQQWINHALIEELKSQLNLQQHIQQLASNSETSQAQLYQAILKFKNSIKITLK